MSKLRLAIVVSHPIQHFCPQYVSLAQNKEVEIKVFFGSALGHHEYVDVNFGEGISWGNLQLDRFDHCFLNEDQVLQPDKNLDATSLEAELGNYNPDIVFTMAIFKITTESQRWALLNKGPIAYISGSELKHKRNPFKKCSRVFLIGINLTPIRYFYQGGMPKEGF